VFVVAHEVMHCALRHHTRRGGRDPQLWNKACDYVVNLALRDAGFAMPAWVLCDDRFAGLGAEQVFRILDQEQKAAEQPPQGQPDCDPSTQGQNGADSDDAPEDEAAPGDDEKPDGQIGDAGDETGDEASDGGEDDEARSTPPDEDKPDGQDGDAGAEAGDDAPDRDGNAPGDTDGEPADSYAGDGDDASGVGNAANDETNDGAPGGGVDNDPEGCGEILDAAPSHDRAALGEIDAEWEVAVREAVNVQRRIDAGSLAGQLQRITDDLNQPRVDWREVLRRFVDPSSTKDYRWSSPNRRWLGRGVVVPGLVSDGVNHVGWITDTSSSIDKDALAQCRGEMQAALDEGAIDRLTVIDCDTRVTHVATFEKGDQIVFTAFGGGGTEFAPAFEWFNEHEPDVSAVIYFTDLCPNGNNFGDEPMFPVLWAAYGDPRIIKEQSTKLTFGECIDVAA
jgi:predicted metal-dependent peptidase